MYFFIIQQNVQKQLQLQQQNYLILTYIDNFFQTLSNIKLTSYTQTGRTYFSIIQTPLLENVQVLFQVQIKDKYLKLQFKPTKLIKFNLQLTSKSQRCYVQLGTQLLTISKSIKSPHYKFYINKHGYLIIEATYFLQQFVNQMGAHFILNKTFIQLPTLMEQMLLKMVSIMRLESIWERVGKSKQDQQQQTQKTIELTPLDKIKYMGLLNEVYKTHRYQTEKEKNIFTIDEIVKTTNLVQQDTKFVEKKEKQSQDYQQKLKEIYRLIKPQTQNKKEHLGMYKMYLTQKQFEKYVKAVKKENLQIYETTSVQFRIVKGVQNKILLDSQKILSQNGAHANIFLGNYKLHLSDTVYVYHQQDQKRGQNKKDVVIKPLVCKRRKNNETEASLNSFKNELWFLFYFKEKRSKFVATYFLPTDKNKDDMEEIFLQYYPQNLKDYLEDKSKNKEPVSLLKILKLAENILLALIFLVENSALHRDLKPYNVMIDKSRKARLIDFGSCCPIYNRTQFSVKQKRILTTPDFQLKYKDTPEVIRKKYQRAEYEQHLLFDIYSFGATLKQMLGYSQHWQSIGQKHGIKVNEILQMIVQKCKQPDPIDRVTFDQLLFYINILKETIQK